MERLLRKCILAGAALVASTLSGSVWSAPLPPDEAQFASYKSLIGTWDVGSEKGGAPVARLQFRWGPNKSYIWYAQSLLMNGEEQPHFEGMLGWNGITDKLDMLLVVDLRYGRALEEGTFSVQRDGSFVRDIKTAFGEGTVPLGERPVGPGGKAEHFRQTYTKVDDNTMLTTVMHETDRGWVPTFPGSDHLKMTRHANG